MPVGMQTHDENTPITKLERVTGGWPGIKHSLHEEKEYVGTPKTECIHSK